MGACNHVAHTSGNADSRRTSERGVLDGRHRRVCRVGPLVHLCRGVCIADHFAGAILDWPMDHPKTRWSISVGDDASGNRRYNSGGPVWAALAGDVFGAALLLRPPAGSDDLAAQQAAVAVDRRASNELSAAAGYAAGDTRVSLWLTMS